MIHSDGNHIVLPHRVQIRSYIICERHIPVGTLTHKITVYINLAAVVHPLKVKELLGGGIFRNGKVFAVPSYPSGEITRTAVERRSGQMLYAPVVRQSERTPAGIHIFNGRHFGCI